MDDYAKQRLADQEIERQHPEAAKQTRWRSVRIFQKNMRPSWLRYGKGTATCKVDACIDNDGMACIQIMSSETALAEGSSSRKKDTTKETYFTAYGPAALEIYEVLREAFEPKFEGK